MVMINIQETKTKERVPIAGKSKMNSMVTYSTPLLMELVPILPHRNSLIQAKHLEVMWEQKSVIKN